MRTDNESNPTNNAATTDNVFGVLNQQAIILAVQALQQDDAKLLTQLGLTDLDDDVASRLKNLTIEHLNSASNFRGSLFQVLFNGRQLNLFLNMAHGKTREDHQINKAIRAGLRQPMLEELKGTPRREYASRRVLMGLQEHSKGRIESLSEEDELLVLTTWQQLNTIEDPLARLLSLHQATGISLDRAWVAIKQFA
jgi:hypothetical protein